MKRMIFVCMLLAFIVGSESLAGADGYSHTVSDGPMSFSWSVEGSMLKVKLTGKTKGWVAVGFNPEVMMKGANFIMGYVKDGKVKVTDHFGNSERNHKADTKDGGKNNFSGVSGSEKGGVTEISFTIPLDSGDPKDKAIDPTLTTTVLLAMGGGRDSFRSVHSYKSVFEVNLSDGTSKKVK